MQLVISDCLHWGGNGNVSVFLLYIMYTPVQFVFVPFSPEKEHLFCSPRLKVYSTRHTVLFHTPWLPSLK